MNRLFLVLTVIVFASCGTNQRLTQYQNENLKLQNQITSLNTANDQLAGKLETAQTSIADLKKRKKEPNKVDSSCDKKLEKFEKGFDGYINKVYKMREEVEAAFPNNLNDQNFSILEEDGRLIISLPNNILYAKGSAEFDQRAQQVLGKLAQVFKANKGLQILVEGHTDDTPIKAGSKYADNWDLSMARAVKVVRQLETYGVHPKRMTAAGRGSFMPISAIDSEEARIKNRRTEIIIRPQLKELMDMLQSL